MSSGAESSEMSRDWIPGLRNAPTLVQDSTPSPGFFSKLRFPSVKPNCHKQQQQTSISEPDVTEPVDFSRRNPFSGFVECSRDALKADELGREIASIALPALLGLAADPLASLVDTAFIGKLGSVELAAVGVSISVFNLISKILNIPLLNITTSYVAEDNAASSSSEEELPMIGEAESCTFEAGGFTESSKFKEKRVLPSVSSALFMGSSLGLVEAIILLLGAWPILRLMGILEDSPMRLPAQQYLTLRALGSPAVVVSLAIQGVFRGFKDTKTPLYATVTGNVVNAVLVPIFMFSLGYGVSGAAAATVISEYVIGFLLLRKLHTLVVLVPPDVSSLGLGRFFKSGGLLFVRTMSSLLTLTLATSLAAHEGVAPMAAHQICMQTWLAASLLSDSLALAGQAVIAEFYAKQNGEKVKEATFRVLQLGAGLGLVMGGLLAVGGRSFTRIFTNDDMVIQAMFTILPFAVFSQPINSIAFVLDGVLFGTTDFSYAAYSMIAIGAVSSGVLLAASTLIGLPGVWIGLTVFMTLRMVSGFVRLGTGTGPWQFLVNENLEIDSPS